ncbi:MAG: hypothetical protein M1814_004234 [Vezdaea aestivalis]|nr:MAG: hypothetical protein M1814_004234 [Vezdaea aestivalis]
MQFTLATFAVLAAALYATGSNAHMLMKTPKPYTSPPLNNSPLDPSGSDFPCKGGAGASFSGAATEMPIGSSQPLAFTGSAVHGGGSCQIAITYESPPPKDVNKWMVIYSIEGGCPAKGVEGNLPNDPSGTGASTYTFKIPDGLKTGEATLAWTWFNKIGNREMYMNCAPVKITGGSKRDFIPEEATIEEREAYDNASLEIRDASFPPLFTANIGGGCATANGDLKFPNPGAALDKFGAGALMDPVGASCAKGSGGSAPIASGSSPSAMPTATASTRPKASQTVPGGVFAPSTTMATMASPTTMMPSASASMSMPSASMASSPPAAMSSAPPVMGGAGAQTPGSACKSEGMWNCLPTGQGFQQCASGMWSAVIQMAAGTNCKAGQSMSLNMGTMKHKRVHHGMRHGARSWF